MCITRLPPAHQSTRAECDLLSSVTLSSQSNGSDFSLLPRISSKKMGNESSTSTLFPRRRLGDGSKFNFFFFFFHAYRILLSTTLFFWGGGENPHTFRTKATLRNQRSSQLMSSVFWRFCSEFTSCL